MSQNIYTGSHGGGSGMLSITGAGIPSLNINDLSSRPHEFDGMDIRITVANNGTIVSVKRDGYGNKPDLYVVHDDQDLGQEIGKIITMTCLTKE
jgi:hypothetical protein